MEKNTSYKEMSKYLLVILMSFYILPMLISSTGIGMLVLLIALPTISFICSYLYGLKNAFRPIFSFAVCILFIPSIYIYYNSTAFIYALMYGVLSLLGLYLGYLTSKK